MFVQTETLSDSESLGGKGGKRQRTRERLIQCAVDIVSEKGFERTSLEEVAQRAGMSRGAIYGNFRNREELFLAVAQELWEPIIPKLQAGSSLKEQMRALADAVLEAAPKRAQRAVGAASFQVYALTSQELRAQLTNLNAEIYDTMEKLVLEFNDESELPLPVPQFVRIVHATVEGLLALRCLTPEHFSDEVVIAAIEALAGERDSMASRGEPQVLSTFWGVRTLRCVEQDSNP